MEFKVVERTSVKGTPVLYFYADGLYLGGLFFKTPEVRIAFEEVIDGTHGLPGEHTVVWSEWAPQQKMVS